MPDIGAVVIGKNEGERLRRCLSSVLGCVCTVVYVDSGSTDGSADLASSMGVDVVRLEPHRPFTAARARNAGFDRLRQLEPDVTLAQFVDGDCELDDGWVASAAAVLRGDSRLAVVCGRLRERDPERSIYNLLCQVEWDAPIGEVDTSGGVFMTKSEAFVAAGGFDATIRRGEEPELCGRLRRAGWKIVRVDEPMALHDAALLRFGQWWTRQMHGAHGDVDLLDRFGIERYRRKVRSARAWTFGWLTAVIVAFAVAPLVFGTVAGLALATVILLALPMQMARVGWLLFRRGYGLQTSAAYGLFMMLGKWAEIRGHWNYWRNRRQRAGEQGG